MSPLPSPRSFLPTSGRVLRLSLTGLLLLGGCSARLLPETGDGGDAGLDDDDGGDNGKGKGGCGQDDGPPAQQKPPSCENYTVEVQSAEADVLVVLDRSGSMRDLTVNRWDPSINAVEDLTASLAPTLRLGLMTFPGDCGSLPTTAEQLDCLARQGTLLGDLTCEPGQLKVAPAFGSAAAISSQLRGMVPTGATPTAATLRAAHKALKDMATPNTTQTVLLVTDGAPNCAAGNVGGLGSVGTGSASGQPQAVPQTVAEIAAMTSDGIKTYVLGYDTQRDPMLKSALDSMAQAGGTGDQVHHAVESHATLRDTLKKLTGRTADCEFVLKSRVVDPWTIRVTLDGKVLTVDQPDGFKLTNSGDNLTVQGAACDSLSDGAKHVLGVEAICPEPVPEPVPDAGVVDEPPDAGVVDEPDAGNGDPDGPPLLYGIKTVCPPDDEPDEPFDAGAPPAPPAPPQLQ